MWKMETTVDQGLYDKGYYLTGEGNRVDIMNAKGDKCYEIFFFGKNDIGIRKERYYFKVNKISRILMDDNEPKIEY